MKKRKITYGISGMMECQVIIKIGNKSTMKVLFTDGSVTAMGVNPATFTTDNFMVQHAIEQSPDYKRGRIRTVNSIELNEEVQIERNKSAANTVKLPETDTNPVNEDGQEELRQSVQSDQVSNEEEQETGEAETDLKKVTVSDLAAAKDYLADTFGIDRSALRGKKAIVEQAAANGIEFEGLS